METITSRQNSTIQHFRSLNKKRSYRRENGTFIIEGVKMWEECIKGNGEIISPVLITKLFLQKNQKVVKKLEENFTVVVISDDLSGYISDTKTPQGLFLQVKMVDNGKNYDKIRNSSKIIVVDDLQDPGNLGTIFRIASAFSIDGIILSENSVDIYSPKVVRSTMGGIFSTATIVGNLSEELANIKQLGFSIYGGALDSTAVPVKDINFNEKSAIIIGNESKGISKQVMELCDSLVYIPISGVESLNAAVAAAIFCWELNNAK